MTSRYNLLDSDENAHDLLVHLNVDLGPLPTLYNIAPTDQVPVIHYFEGRRLISNMQWWLVPHWADEATTKYPMFNARYENLQKSRAFSGNFRHRRCIIPASSYIEWEHNQATKTPHLFSAKTHALAFAGIWDYWTDGIEHILSCAIVTQPSLGELANYHYRTPVILTPEQAEFWLTEKYDLKALAALCCMPVPYPLVVSVLDEAVNQVKNKNEIVIVEDVELIMP